MIKVLFVCTGNICRSPTAEAVFSHAVAAAGLTAQLRADSCGTHAYHVGEAPDPRSQAAAARRGYDLSPLRARKLRPTDFDDFDLLLAMDHGHLRTLEHQCPPVRRDRLQLMLAYHPDPRFDEVPDPYYGGARGFETVLDLLETATDGLLGALRPRLGG